ncbi:MAG: hypothetical protein SFY95_08820 [Planctomycetota bacterium]|nr:hypothetical protein [Planctomycetota bacterium]
MLLIDAYNVLWAASRVGLEPLELADLARLLIDSRYGRRPALLVCDGVPEGFAASLGRLGDLLGGRVRIRCAGPGREADDVIEELLEAAPEQGLARGWVVVTSDRRLIRAARVVGARAMDAEDFLRHLAADDLRGRTAPKRPAFATDLPLDPYSVGQWMREFGLDASDLPTPARRAELAPVPRAPKPAAPQAPPRAPDETLPDDRLDAELWAAGLDAVDIDMERWLKLNPPTESSRAPRVSPGRRPRSR